jgi:serine/threonine protein phosphatase 1
MGRTLVIGDIHGGMRAVKQVFERAAVTKKDKLIFLGDYVDSWSESPQVLDFLISLAATHSCVFLRGNHDDLLMDWLRGKDNELWHQHGGAATMKAYFRLTAEAKTTHIYFLQSLQNYHLDKKNRLYLHAGFTNMHGVAYENYPRLMFWDRTLWEMAVGLDKKLPTTDPRYPRRLLLYKEIYIGHTPVTKIGKTVPVNMANVWNIDTGAAFKGPLTVIDADTKEFWQSDPLPDLYPLEKGRN